MTFLFQTKRKTAICCLIFLCMLMKVYTGDAPIMNDLNGAVRKTQLCQDTTEEFTVVEPGGKMKEKGRTKMRIVEEFS